MGLPSPMAQYFDELLRKSAVLIRVNATHDAVRVPEALKESTALVLRLSYNFGAANPITVHESGIEARLTFQGAVFDCWIPYEAIAAITAVEGPPKPVMAKPSRAHLTLIKGGLN